MKPLHKSEARTAIVMVTPETQEHAHHYLPEQLLTEYHRLLDKKFAKGLSAEDRFDLEKIERLLDSAEMSLPTEAAETRDQARYEQMTATLESVLRQLEDLR